MTEMSEEEALVQARDEIAMAVSANQMLIGSLAVDFKAQDWSLEVRVSEALEYARIIPPTKLQIMWAVMAEMVASQLLKDSGAGQ